MTFYAVSNCKGAGSATGRQRIRASRLDSVISREPAEKVHAF